ncbi:MAG: hypothetical protein ACE5KA_00515 [Nitrososphaerales archaeon]
MIVTKKMLIGAAIIPIIIALAIAVPKMYPNGDQPSSTNASLLRIEFIKEDMKRVSHVVTERAGALRSETLIIDEKRQAFYDVKVEGEKGFQTRFQVNLQDMKRLKALITDTGFMQIPKSEFVPTDDAQEFTRYTLKVTLDNQAKTIQWVDESSSKDFVPPLLVMLSDTLAKIIENNSS